MNQLSVVDQNQTPPIPRNETAYHMTLVLGTFDSFDMNDPTQNSVFTNLMTALVNQNILTVIGLIFMEITVIELPIIYLIYKIYTGSSNILLPILPIAVFFTMWFMVLKNRKVPLYITFLYPILFVLLIIISIISTIKTGFGKGADWKGRLVKCHSKQVYEKQK